MNAVRFTHYPPTASGTPDSYEPLTVVLRESDLREDLTLEQATMDTVDQSDQDGLFVITETFDVPDDANVEEATGKALELMREREQVERRMACLYQYEAGAFSMTNEGAHLVGTIAAPLDAADVARTFRRLMNHPRYNAHSILVPTQDEKLVMLAHGDITIEEMP